MTFRLFLSQSFAGEKLDNEGRPNVLGTSDAELGDQVARYISNLSGGRIDVVRTRDPFGHYISESVRHDICSSDAVLCLFTKRTKDHLKNQWLPSSYVVSEASAALMQFPSEHETHRRLFGLVEEGVDRQQLGMAFHGNKVAPIFQRGNESQLASLVRSIVDKILDPNEPLPERRPCEYLVIDKVLSVLRSGWVLVETRHRFRFTDEVSTVRIPHTMWRVSKELPVLDQLLAPIPDQKVGFLRVMPLLCGRHDPLHQRCLVKPRKPAMWDYERNFLVEFPDIQMRPGEELEYEVVWTYPHAFHNPPLLGQDDRPNSVGLRTSERGQVASASMTLKFQRDLEGEPKRILESHPQVYTTHVNNLPGSQTPEDFLHTSETWQFSAELRPCLKRSCNLFETYHWTTRQFEGMAKIIWTPHVNYFNSAGGRRPTLPVESINAIAS